MISHQITYQPDGHSAVCRCGRTWTSLDEAHLRNMVDRHLFEVGSYEIVPVEGRMVKEVYIVTLNDVAVIRSDGDPVWFLRIEDAEHWVDERIARPWP